MSTPNSSGSDYVRLPDYQEGQDEYIESVEKAKFQRGYKAACEDFHEKGFITEPF
jgi:hypothetical protein